MKTSSIDEVVTKLALGPRSLKDATSAGGCLASLPLRAVDGTQARSRTFPAVGSGHERIG